MFARNIQVRPAEVTARIVVQVSMHVGVEPRDTQGMEWNVREDRPIKHPSGLDLLKPPGIHAGMKHIMIPHEEALVATQERHDAIQGLLMHGHVAEVIDVILRLHDRIPSVDHGLIHLLDRAELRSEEVMVFLGIGPPELEDIRVTEVSVRCEPDVHHYVMSNS